MRITCILATLGDRKYEIKRLFKSLDEQVYKKFEVIIVSQNNHEEIDEWLNEVEFFYKHIRINKRGLSIARNIGIKYAQGDIICFTDDDCWYDIDAFNFIVKYIENNNTDIVCFEYYDCVKKAYPKRYGKNIISNLSEISILRRSSIEIFINIKQVEKSNIYFDERFGVGARYPSSEETILLMDLIKRKYRVSFVPKVIVYHRCTFDVMIFDYKMWSTKGAVFRRLFGCNLKGIILFLLMSLKKIRKLHNPIKCIYHGFKEFISLN